MTDTILILGGGIVALIVLLVVLAARSKPASAQPPVSVRASAPPRENVPPPAATASNVKVVVGHDQIDKFRGGMIFPQPDPCAPVTLLRGKTFPEGRIPGIPVAGCTRGRCDCQVHTVVGRRRGPRRSDPDRRDDVRINDDRRSGQDRRSA